MKPDEITDQLAAVDASLEAMRAEAAEENRLRAVRIAKSEEAIDEANRTSRRAVVVAAVSVVVGLTGVFGAVVANRAADKSQSAIDANTQGRVEGRKAVCDGFAAFTGALIAASPPSTPEEAAVRQAQIDAFTADLDERLAPLGCRISDTFGP